MSDAAPLPLTVIPSAEFMEDFRAGRPWRDDWNLDTMLVSRDGTAQILAAAANPVTLARIAPDPESLTGWSAAATLMPDQDYRSVPTVIIVPGVDADTVLIYRMNAINSATFAPDGTLSAFSSIGMPGGIQRPQFAVPARSGPIPPGVSWIPEFVFGRLDYAPAGMALRSLVPNKPYLPVAGADLFPQTPSNLTGTPRIWPLGTAGPDTYRCIAQANDGDAVLLATYEITMGQAHLRQRIELPGIRPAGASIAVQPLGPGQALVALYDTRPSTDDNPALQTLLVTYDPASAAPAEVTLLPGGPKDLPRSLPQDARIELLIRKNEPLGDIELYFNVMSGNAADANYPELWSTTLAIHTATSGAWTEAALLDRGCRAMPAALDPARFCVLRPATGYELWTRETSGEFTIEEIDLPAENVTPTAIASVRVGLKLIEDGRPLAGAAVGVTADVSCAATFDGRHIALRTARPQTFTTDANGQLWLTLPVEESLYVPTIVFHSPRFGADLHFNPDPGIQNKLASLSEDELKGGADPRTGTRVLGHPDRAGAGAEAIRKLMEAKPTPDHSRAISPAANVTAVADPRLCWMPEGVPPSVRPPANAPSWRLDPNTGTFTELHPEAAQAHIARLTAAYAAPHALMFSFLDDIGDFFSDLGRAIAKGFAKLADLVVDGAKVVVHFVVDSIDYVYHGLMDTIDRVLDAVTFILDAVGCLLGTFVGWLLELLGFLFDWKAIKAKRTEYRDFFKDNIGLIKTMLPNPADGAKAFSARLDTIRDDIVGTLQDLRSEPLAKEKFDSIGAGLPSIPGLPVGEAAGWVLSQLAWVQEKFMYPLFRGRTNVGTIAASGLEDALARLVPILQSASEALLPSIGDLIDLTNGWIIDGKLFGAAALDPLIDVLIRHLDALIRFAKQVVTLAGDVLYALWNEPDTVRQWLDTKISIPFLSGFYRGLAGNDLSLLDLACLIAAIPGSLISPPRQTAVAPLAYAASSPAPPTPKQQAAAAAQCFMVVGCVTTAISAGISLGNSNTSPITDIAGGLNLAINLGVTFSQMVAAGELWEEIVIPSLVVLVGLAVVTKRVRAGTLVEPGTAVLSLSSLVQMCRAVSRNQAGQISYQVFSIVQDLLSLGARIYTNGGENPRFVTEALGYGALQGTLSGIKTSLYIALDT